MKPSDLKIGAYYYFEEHSICPASQIIKWLYQLRTHESNKNIVFTVLTTNKKDFCDPGLNIADISCTNEYWLFKASTVRVFKEVTPEDFPQYMNFPLLKEKFCSGSGRIYYHGKETEMYKEVLDMLLLLRTSDKITFIDRDCGI